mgnify:CR=1 FL=1
MKKAIYRSRIDLWLVTLLIFTVVVSLVPLLTEPWWIAAILGIGMCALMCVAIFGCWYVIDGNSLVIYQFLRPQRFPIGKIKEIKSCNSILAAPALSSKRIAIKFNDRRILKSSMPLEISPKDRQRFVSHLLKINPEIHVAYDR